MSQPQNTHLRFALLYAETLGFSVIPLRPRDKRPQLSSWKEFQTTAATADQIREWWSKWPNANVGIVTGAVSNLVVLDEDGPEGRALIEQNGGCDGAIVHTSKGRHFYFQHPGFRVQNFARKLPGLDLRGDGGYVAAPPSIHETGVLYEWKSEPLRFEPVPEWLLEHLRATPEPASLPVVVPATVEGIGSGTNPKYVDAALQNVLEQLSRATKGNRNDELNRASFSLAGFVAAGALDEADVRHRLTEVAESIGLKNGEIKQTIDSGFKKGMEKPRDIPEAPKRRMLRASSSVRSYIEQGSDPDGDSDEPAFEAGMGPYAVRDGCIVHSVEKHGKEVDTTHSQIVCDLVAQIDESIMAEDGAGMYHIIGRAKRGREFEFELTVDEFADEKKLRARLEAAAGPQSPVRAGMAKHLGPAVKLLTGSDLKKTNLFNRTGWFDKYFLIPGREYPNIVVQVGEPPYGLEDEADLEKGLDCLEMVLHVQSLPMTTVVAAMMFQAPLADLAGWRNERYGVFITGQTGSLKSTCAQFFMALYGKDFLDDSNILKWGDGGTRNAIGRIVSISHDLPVLIDNYKPNTGNGSKDFVSVIHNILEGAEKRRLDRFSKLVGKRPIFCWPLITGEDVPEDDAASLARILVVPFPVPDEETETALNRVQKAAPHLCAVGKAWIEWLESDAGRTAAREAAEKYEDARAEWRAYLRNGNSKVANPFRVASNLASNSLTWEVMSKCPFLASLAQKYKDVHRAGLQQISSSMAYQTSESMEANRFLSVLREQLNSERCIILDYGSSVRPEDRERVIGWHGKPLDDGQENVLLQRDSSIQAVKRVIGPMGLNNMSSSALYKQLLNMGALADFDKGKLTKKARPSGGSSDNYLCIKSEFLFGSEDENND